MSPWVEKGAEVICKTCDHGVPAAPGSSLSSALLLRGCSFWDAEIHQGALFFRDGQPHREVPRRTDHTSLLTSIIGIFGQCVANPQFSEVPVWGPGQPQHLPRASLSPTRPVQPSSLTQAAAITAASAHTPMELIFPFCETDFNSFPTTPWQ